MKSAEKRHILIHVNGSEEIGLGHIYRMKTLGEALHDKHAISFLSVKHTVANDLLRSTGAQLHDYNVGQLEEVASNVMRHKPPALIIQDVLETSSKEMAFVKSCSAAPVINFDDCGAGLNEAHILINGIVFTWGRYTIANCRARIYEGPQYMICPAELRKHRRDKHAVPGDTWNLFLTFGGTDNHGITERAVAALNNVPRPLDISVNLGPACKPSDALKATVQSSPHKISILRAVPDLFQHMSACDLLICAGGTTLFQAATLGVPSISIAAEPHELHNLKYWSEAKSTVALGYEQELNFSDLTNAVMDLMKTSEKLEQMSENGKKLADGRGLERIIDIIDRELALN
jgi:UDP-2,4-diacetamido-2,4,6-trideoxy-beta-L-altropyranose hydrolase